MFGAVTDTCHTAKLLLISGLNTGLIPAYKAREDNLDDYYADS